MGRFKFEKLSKYPHLQPEDILVWERFIESKPGFFDTVDYDVHVGEGTPHLPTGEDTPEGRENRLYQKKIDVVGYKDGNVSLVEVKPIANMRGLGQILTYFNLYGRHEGAMRPPVKLVIAGEIEREVEKVYAEHGVNVILV